MRLLKNRYIAFCAVVLFVLFAGGLVAQQMGKFQPKAGGNEIWGMSGLTLRMKTGSIQDFESGSALKIAGTQVTSSAAELNLIDGSTAGTAVASKAFILGSLKNADSLFTDVLGLNKFVMRPSFRSNSADSALVGVIVSGVPELNFYGTDGDTWKLTMNTDDQAILSGADALAVSGNIFGKQPVHAITAAADTVYTTTTPYSSAVTPCISGTMFYARPLAQKSTLFLQGAAAGIWFDVVVADTDSLRMVAASGDSILVPAGTASRSIGTVAGTCRVVALDAVRWQIVNPSGTWTADAGEQ